MWKDKKNHNQLKRDSKQKLITYDFMNGILKTSSG